jgi:hypothetical protein
MTELSSDERLVVNSVRNVTRLLALGWLAAVAVLVARVLSGTKSLSAAGIIIPIRYSWIIFTIFTLVHVAESSFTVRHIESFKRTGYSKEAGNSIFETIRSDRNLLVHGLIPRVKPWRVGSHWYRMDPQDPSAWVAYLGQITLFLAVLPWSLSRSGQFVWEPSPLLWLGIALAFVIASLNWYSGSSWILALSSLAKDSDPVLEFLRGKDSQIRFSPVGTWIFRALRALGFIAILPILIFVEFLFGNIDV